MKIKLLIFSLLLIVSTAPLKAQTAEIIIQTSGQCLECKSNIEKAVMAEKGVRFAEFDMKSKKVKVVYNSKRTDPEAIRKVISATGYDADEVKAEKAGIDKLSPCCRPGGHPE